METPLNDEEVIPVDPEKISILSGASHSAATFSLKDEDHTLGNSLRYIIMKNPNVEFCGYSLPHPSEPKFHLRIQMYHDHHHHHHQSALEALKKGLSDLEDLTLIIMNQYQQELSRKTFSTYEESTVEQRLEEIKRIKYPHLLTNNLQSTANMEE